jgi:putative transposase
MAQENPGWAEGRIADELSLKLGLFVDSRSVGKYLKQGGRPRQPSGNGSSLVRLRRDRDRLAADTSRQRKDHPTSEWTRQQFREFLDGESGHRYLIHDRDSVFSAEVDAALNGFGLEVLKTPVRSPMANAYCERVIGTIRRDCLT